MSSNAFFFLLFFLSFFFFCGGGFRTGNGITQQPGPIYCLSVQYVAYLFYKTLKLPIINVKPIALIKNHKINDKVYGNLANEHFKMSKKNRKQGYFV